MPQVEIFDTTLRDGSQAEGLSLTVNDKIRVAEQLDLLGEVVPVLRQELDAKRPADVPDGPTHESLVAASLADAELETSTR